MAAIMDHLYIVVGDHVFTPEDNLNITCVQQPDSTGLEGTWVVHLMLNIFDIAKSWNSSEPVPITVLCNWQ